MTLPNHTLEAQGDFTAILPVGKTLTFTGISLAGNFSTPVGDIVSWGNSATAEHVANIHRAPDCVEEPLYAGHPHGEEPSDCPVCHSFAHFFTGGKVGKVGPTIEHGEFTNTGSGQWINPGHAPGECHPGCPQYTEAQVTTSETVVTPTQDLVPVTQAEVQSGQFRGHRIRKARKAYECEQITSPWGSDEYRRCGATIRPGDRYVEGDVDPYRAGGFGHERLCLNCGGVA